MKLTPDSELDPQSLDELQSGSPFSSYPTKESRRSGAILAGRYQVRGFLQRGAHARIYLAEDLTTGSPVALKILAPETALSPEFRIRLVREGRAMKSIAHPNVAAVLDSGVTEEGVPFLALEALLGETLGEYVRREQIPLDIGLILVRQAAAGLSAAHRA